MIKFAWTLKESGWSIEKLAQAPTAEQYKEVADAASRKKQEDASKAMKAVTGQPLSTDPAKAQQQMSSLPVSAVGNAVSKATGGAISPTGNTPDELAKSMIGQGMEKSPMGAVMSALSPSDEEQVKMLSDPATVDFNIQDLKKRVDRISKGEKPLPSSQVHTMGIFNDRIAMLEKIKAGQAKPQDYVNLINQQQSDYMKSRGAK